MAPPKSSTGRGGGKGKRARSPTSSTSEHRRSPLPPQYSFTPASDGAPLPTLSQSRLHFPPPPDTTHPASSATTPATATATTPATSSQPPPANTPEHESQPTSSTPREPIPQASVQSGPSQGQLSLDDLLRLRAQDGNFPRLSPNVGDGKWFDRDEAVLVRRVSKILKDKFDGPYYSWTVTPPEKQDQYFTQLAVSGF